MFLSVVFQGGLFFEGVILGLLFCLRLSLVLGREEEGRSGFSIKKVEGEKEVGIKFFWERRRGCCFFGRGGGERRGYL